MPKFIVNTNISKDKVPDSFIGELAQHLSKALGKPAQMFSCVDMKLLDTVKAQKKIQGDGSWQYLVIQISPDQVMSFGGSTEPCAVCFLLGKLGDQENKAYSKLLCDLTNKQLQIPADRIYISFFEISAGKVAWNSTTFA